MKILVIGNGIHTSKRIIPALLNINNITCIEIVDRKKTNIEESGKVRIKNFDHLDKNCTYDFIIIASTPNSHLENFEQIKTFSDIFLIEKPLSNNSKLFEYKDFLKDKSAKRIFEGLMYLHHPLWDEAINVFKSNNVQSIEANFTIPEIDKQNFRYRKDKGGGFTLDLGIYPLSLFFSLEKEDYIINKFSKVSDNNFDVDLGGKIEIKTKSGIKFNSSWGISDVYSNELRFDTLQSSYHFPFIFSKPDNYDSYFEIFSEDNTEKTHVGEFNQFTLMYKNIINNNFHKFTNYRDQEKTYNLLFDLIK